MSQQKFEVTIEVEKVNGHCSAEHNVGDSWVTSSPDKPLGICPVALMAIWQKVYAMMAGAQFWWSENPDVARFSCPDMGIVTFKITRKALK